MSDERDKTGKGIDPHSDDTQGRILQTVGAILEFVSVKKLSLTIEPFIVEIGQQRFRVISIWLLWWLKTQARQKMLEPLQINRQYPWCRELLVLIERRQFLSGLISVDEDSVVLRADIPVDFRETVLSLVNERYQPPLKT